MLELNKGRIFEGQSDNCLKRKYIDSRSSITKDKRNRSERVPLDNLLPRAKEEGVVVGDEDGLIYISSHKVQRKPESSCEEAGWQTSQWTDQAIRNCFFSRFSLSHHISGPKACIHHAASSQFVQWESQFVRRWYRKTIAKSTHNWHREQDLAAGQKLVARLKPVGSVTCA
jgi:hypothetical protein